MKWAISLTFVALVCAGCDNPPSSPTTEPSVLLASYSAGTYDSFEVIDGKIRGWGSNRAGQLGQDNDNPDQFSTPVGVSVADYIVSVSAGGYQTMALSKSGEVWSFGADDTGARGDGLPLSAENRGFGTPIKLGLKNIIQISSGGRHNLVLDSSGNIWAWGSNINGQLGVEGDTSDVECGSTAGGPNSPVPIKVPIEVKIKQISAGYCNSFALDENGKVWSWGFGDYLGTQLGQGKIETIQHISRPTMISTLSNIVKISAGASCSFALDSEKNIWAWGANREGCAGNGTTDLLYSPIRLALTNVADVVARSWGGFAIKSDGTLWSWGETMYGSVGNGKAITKPFLDYSDRIWEALPVQISNWTDVVAVYSGPTAHHAFVVRVDKSVWTWGRNKAGNLGNGKIGNDDSTNVSPDDENIASPVRLW